MVNQKGFIHIFFLLIMLVGLALTVYLVQQKQIFEGRASELPKTVYFLKLRELTQQSRLDRNALAWEIYSPNSSSRYDLEVFVTTLQGIVNRNGPNLYVDSYAVPVPQYNEYGQSVSGTTPVAIDTDIMFGIYRQQGGWLSSPDLQAIPIQYSLLVPPTDKIWHDGIRSLIQTFPIQGIIVWDPNVSATVNVATTVAGLADLPVVRYDPSPDSLYTFLTKPVDQGGRNGIKVVMNLYGIFKDPATGKVITDNGYVPGTDKKVLATKSAKNNAYLWAKYHYLDNVTGEAQVDPSTLAYLEDGYALNETSDITDCSTTRDMVIKRRAFVFDLSPVKEEIPVDEVDIDKKNPTPETTGIDYSTFKSILASANNRLGNYTGTKKLIQILGYVPLWDKYNQEETCLNKQIREYDKKEFLVPGQCKDTSVRQKHAGFGTAANAEYPAVRLASAYNAYYAHLCDGGTNLSFHSWAPVPDKYPAQNTPPTKTLENKTYILFNFSDVDGPAFVVHMAGIWKNQKKRGNFPAAWSFDPQPDLMPQIYNYFYQTKGAGDFFTGGNSSIGWLFPGQFIPPRYAWYPVASPNNPQDDSGLPSALDLWKNRSIELYQQFNLDITSQAWNNGPLTDEIRNAYAEISPKGLSGLFTDERTQKGEQEQLYGSAFMPIKNMAGGQTGLATLTGDRDKDVIFILSESMRADSLAQTSPTGQTKPNFLIFRDVLHGPDYYYGLMNYVRQFQANPDNPIYKYISKYRYEVVDPYTFFNLYKQSLSQGVTPTPTTIPVDNPSPAKFTEVHPSSPTTKATSGTFDIIATGAINTDMIWFGVWTLTNQIDDLKWYQGTNQGGGNWVGKIDLSKHTGIDTIFVRACATNKAFPQIDANTFCKDTSFKRVS